MSHDQSWRPTNAHKSSALLKRSYCLLLSCSFLLLLHTYPYLGYGTVFALPYIYVSTLSLIFAVRKFAPSLSHCMTSMLTVEGSLLLMCVGPLLFQPCHSLGCCGSAILQQPEALRLCCCVWCLLGSCYVSTCGYEITSMINGTGFSYCRPSNEIFAAPLLSDISGAPFWLYAVSHFPWGKPCNQRTESTSTLGCWHDVWDEVSMIAYQL